MPLSGCRVLDLTTVRSGPTCTKILADLGAEVLRVERPGDSGRERAFFDQGDLQRNKKSLVLNLQHPKGVEVLRALAARADAVVENYRPDVKHRLGIDYESLSRDNPRLIYASISGFGQEGPYRDRPGYDQIVQGMSGLMSLTGTEETAPLRIGIPIGDLLAGYFAALGILAALIERERSGRGQQVETSLLEALVGSLSFQAVRYLNTGEVPPPVGNHHPLTAPMGVYRVKDGHLNLAVGNDDMWGRLCRALGLPELADDPRFAKRASRLENRAAMDEILEAALAKKSAAEWVELLNAAGVASGPIYTVDEVFGDPQVAQAGLVHELRHPLWGLHRVMGLPVRLHRTPAQVRTAAPLPGAHTREILAELGYDEEATNALLADGVVEEAKR
ncbi:MAG: CoA transferase [Candidatus Rokubacteria bacterium]|nr:CoA transferase [Candidatus Rokubacteria bacterium]